MDDAFEEPGSTAVPENPEGEEVNSSGDEDNALDWSKLAGNLAKGDSLQKPVIPKRGEKDFQPRDGGSSLQSHNLTRARTAMFNVLRSTRGISSKNASYGIWMPRIARAHVTVAKGVLFNSMGHSATREVLPGKWAKRLELLPEEALYLVERGTLISTGEPAVDGSDGPPISIQQAYAEMIGKDDLTLEKYQVYAYLKRLGYAVTRYRTPADSPYYPLPPPYLRPVKQSCLLHRYWRSLLGILKSFPTSQRWWKPISLQWHHSPSSVLAALRFIPSGFDHSISKPSEVTPYEIFYNIYKPTTPFKRTAPPPADFHIVVVDANATTMPTLPELCSLFDQVTESGPPPPRRRGNQPAAPPLPVRQLAWYLRLMISLGLRRDTRPPARGPHPYAILRSGKKNVVIAAVDNGNISFFRFGQGAFHEMPML